MKKATLRAAERLAIVARDISTLMKYWSTTDEVTNHIQSEEERTLQNRRVVEALKLQLRKLQNIATEIRQSTMALEKEAEDRESRTARTPKHPTRATGQEEESGEISAGYLPLFSWFYFLVLLL